LRGYAEGGFYTYPTVRFWRWIFQRLWPTLRHYPPLIYTYLFGSLGFALGKIWRPLSYPLRAIFPTAWLPDYRWAILDTFDAVTPNHQSSHTPTEIENWLRQAGFASIQHQGGNDFVGKKGRDLRE